MVYSPKSCESVGSVSSKGGKSNNTVIMKDNYIGETGRMHSEEDEMVHAKMLISGY